MAYWSVKMQNAEFKNWLKEQGYQPNVVNTRAGNCETVCNYEGDLDILYSKDKCHDLLNRLSYSKDDERHNRPTKHFIPINGNKRTGSATLKQAVNLYIKFLNKDTFTVSNRLDTNIKNNISVKNDWPKWLLPTEEETYQLAKIITKYIRFLSPDIIQRIVIENEKIKKSLSCKLKSKGIDPNLYLWEKSSCCFPGVRRYAGSSEISAYRKRSEISEIEDAIALDDNDYPKQIWSFIFKAAKFSKFGPKGYSLAHLVDHKKYKNRMADEFVFENNYKFEKPFYGLYTCATNSIFIPNSLMKPTDFNGSIRNLFFRKAESLYGKYCNLVPAFAKVKQNTEEKWNVENFEWTEPVGDLTNIDAFLDFRKNKLEDLLK